MYEEIQINESIMKINKNANHYPKMSFMVALLFLIFYIQNSRKLIFFGSKYIK